jgi:hypothetical protein
MLDMYHRVLVRKASCSAFRLEGVSHCISPRRRVTLLLNSFAQNYIGQQSGAVVTP